VLVIATVNHAPPAATAAVSGYAPELALLAIVGFLQWRKRAAQASLQRMPGRRAASRPLRLVTLPAEQLAGTS